MKITDFELNIKSFVNVQTGCHTPSYFKCGPRHSDCFAYVIEGWAEYTFDGEHLIAQTGDVIFLARNSCYSLNISAEKYNCIFFDFFFDHTQDTILKNEIYSSKSVSMLRSDFEKLYNLWNTGDFSDKIFCRSLVYKIYSAIVKSGLSQYISHGSRKQLEKIADYIIENASDSNLNIAGISKLFNISEVHLRRIFSCIYHTSPIKFITGIRINKAKELLVSENCNISEIAARCGFANHYYFSKVFKAETNMTPREFRTFYKTNL